MQGTSGEINKDIDKLLIRCRDKKMTDKKGKKIHSNFKSLYAPFESQEDAIVEKTPVDLLIESNWEKIKTKYEDYITSDVMESEDLDVIKVLFMENMMDRLKRFENDPLNTTDAIHVTGSESQSLCDFWKQERYLLATASQFDLFVRNVQLYCKNLWLGKDLSNVPAIKWGRTNEKFGIQELEKKVKGKVTKSGLHISRKYPVIGNYMMQNLELNLL